MNDSKAFLCGVVWGMLIQAATIAASWWLL